VLSELVKKLDVMSQNIAESAEQAPNRVVDALKKAERASRPGSKLLVSDYNGFHSTQGQLVVPAITDSDASAYGDLFRNATGSVQRTVAGGAQEKEIVQPLTLAWLKACLQKEEVDTTFSIGTEIGYHAKDDATNQFFHGFADKAAFAQAAFSQWDKSTPSNKEDILQSYDCPIVALGVWEDKGIDVSLGKEAKAELMAEMKGFHEGSKRTHGVTLAQLGGLLINMDAQLEPSCVCIRMEHRDNRLFWHESQILQGLASVASAIKWWIGLLGSQQQDFDAQQLLQERPSSNGEKGRPPQEEKRDEDDNCSEGKHDEPCGLSSLTRQPVARTAAQSQSDSLLSFHAQQPIPHEAFLRDQWVTSYLHGNLRIYA
jgi:hypothetical protein